jgi:hypothetical protein
MSRPKARYKMVVKKNFTGEQLKIELVDHPFLENRRFRVRQWSVGTEVSLAGAPSLLGRRVCHLP